MQNTLVSGLSKTNCCAPASVRCFWGFLRVRERVPTLPVHLNVTDAVRRFISNLQNRYSRLAWYQSHYFFELVSESLPKFNQKSDSLESESSESLLSSGLVGNAPIVRHMNGSTSCTTS
jgi:hypothetical protein